MKTLALLDGDILAYRCSASNATNGGDLDDLHYHLQATLDDWTERSGGADHKVFLTFGPTFRHHFYPQYKQNRVGKPKPNGLQEAYAWLRSYEKSVWEDGYEADDIMATAASSGSEDGCKVIVSTDKDFAQVPLCRIYNPVKDTTEEPTRESADLFRLQQWVCGDTVDGYGGIYGYGSKTFAKDVVDEVFSSWDEMEDWGYAKYEDKGYDEDFALQMLVCSTLIHHHICPTHRSLVQELVGNMSISPTPS